MEIPVKECHGLFLKNILNRQIFSPKKTFWKARKSWGFRLCNSWPSLNNALYRSFFFFFCSKNNFSQPFSEEKFYYLLFLLKVWLIKFGIRRALRLWKNWIANFIIQPAFSSLLFFFFKKSLQELGYKSFSYICQNLVYSPKRKCMSMLLN